MKIDLEAIRARCEAATPGPWHVIEEGFGAYDSPRRVLLEAENGQRIFWDCDLQGPHSKNEDSEFIAAARTDVPALLAYVEELTQERDALREEMFAWQHAVEYVLGKDWMHEGHGPKEARAELARRAKESADEYADLKHREVMLKRAHGALADAGCVVPIEIDRTIEHAINQLAQERDEERMRTRCFEQAHAEAEADVRELRARIAELEARCKGHQAMRHEILRAIDTWKQPEVNDDQ